MRGLKNELVKDLYVVLCTVTKSPPTNRDKNQAPKQAKHKNTKNTKPKTQHKQAKQRRDRCQFMGEMG